MNKKTILYSKIISITGDKNTKRVTMPKNICDTLNVDLGDKIIWISSLKDDSTIEVTVKNVNSDHSEYVNKTIYITSYCKDQITADDLKKQYDEKCVICGETENLCISTVLSESAYESLSNESWNKVFLCESCKNKLNKENKKDKNGIKNLVSLINKENKKRIDWFKK